MKWSEFYAALKDGRIEPVYVFTGPEEYVKREALQALRDRILPPGLEALNDTVMEGVTAQQITDAAETMPMMCERRMVTVRDWAPLLSAKAKNEEAEAEWMEKWLAGPPSSCTLVFYMRGSWDGRKKLCGALKKQACVVEFDPLTDAELTRWSARFLKPRGKKIGTAALNTLTFMAGQELTRLSGELDKLAAYLGDRAEITAEDVEAIVPASLEYNVFELLNSLLAGDMVKAQSSVNSLLQGGQTAMGLLAMLTRQLRQLAHIKCALDAGGTVQQVQDQLKIHPYAAKQSARQCAKLSADWLTDLYQQCIALDYAVKSGQRRDRDALDTLILRIGLAPRR